MGKLCEGVWQKDDVAVCDIKGRFKREKTYFNEQVTADGSSGFPAEADRYHLYISYACPWACRALIMRQVKKLTDVISLSIVDSHMGDFGWEFTGNPGCIPDSLFNYNYLHQIYTHAKPDYTGRVTVPVLWDKQQETIVNNESAQIIRILNSEFNALTNVDYDYYPESLRSEIDEINDFVYHNINNGVYKCGFAKSQVAYDEAFISLFSALDKIEKRLSENRYLVGEKITEADWRLFTTLVRFDPVYVGHFKCNKKRMEDFHHIQNYLRELYQMPGISDTVNMDHIKQHYYGSHQAINPTGIVPLGPDLSLDAPHDRASLRGA